MEERSAEKKKEKRNFWLTYFTCQGGAGMLNRVVTVHAYSIHIGLYGYIWDCVYSTLSVCLCGIVLEGIQACTTPRETDLYLHS